VRFSSNRACRAAFAREKSKNFKKIFAVPGGFHSDAIRAHHIPSAQFQLARDQHSTIHGDARLRAAMQWVFAPESVNSDFDSDRPFDWIISASCSNGVGEESAACSVFSAFF